MYFTYSVTISGVKVNIMFILNLVLIRFNALNRFCLKAIILKVFITYTLLFMLRPIIEIRYKFLMLIITHILSVLVN